MAELLKGETGDWEMVIGLEVHAQVTSNAKLFSGAPTEFGAEPNTQVSLVDAAMPGMLPVLNEESVRQAVRTGLAINSEINLHSVFARKNYFYPDLPQGYQISQYELPIVGEGEVEIDLEDGTTKPIGIERLHLEQDAGKSVHDMHATKSYIDLNRSGVTLMEIVSKPDLRSADEAAAYISKIRSILRYIGACDGNMQEGSLRADVNVSVRHPGDDLGIRCEIKNVNSIRFVRQAIEREARRQIEVLEDGGEIEQETRLYDPDRNETRSMRTKEDAHDYRYFPDPDLLPLDLEQEFVDALKAELPELPDARKERFMSDYALGAYDASVLVAERDTGDYFDTVAKGRDAKQAANWVQGELFGRLNKDEIAITESPVSAEALGGLIDLISDDTISGRIAKEVFDEMWASGKDAAAIVEEKGLKQITDTGEIEAAVDQVIADNPDNAAEVRGGNMKAIGWFVGQVMQATGGKANPKAVNELLRKKLSG
ncbi:MAG: Asp-tRNA(Asn)/Glu-tRNA(Gln) amidotransferase GatCAB subunit B [Rhodospirillaceae bacterium]|nr:Asp-tRNA(Asn)/Glu-tRNA(Gln) amidotransferase GatCAB subunit B [Rhodospirillaceae bacterium]